MRITDDDMIIKFLSGDGNDHLGRSLSEMISGSDIELEQCHDKIQWLFPLHEDSKKARSFPVISKSTVEKSKCYPNIVKNLLISKERFEKFFGIGNYQDKMKQDRWCRPRNHNLLRITRIIRCLRIFGLEKEAKEFYNHAMAAAATRYVSNTIDYWDMALNNDIWSALQK